MISFKKFEEASCPTPEEFKAATKMPDIVGDHVLTISSVEVKGESQDDPSFVNVELTLNVGRLKFKHWLNVPTERVDYRHKEESKKNPFSEFLMLQQFVSALGGDLQPTADSLNEVLPGLFESEDTLVNQRVGATVGYYAHHVKENDEGKFFLADRDGKPIDKETYDQREEAEMDAAAAGLYIQKFPKILRFKKPNEVSKGDE